MTKRAKKDSRRAGRTVPADGPRWLNQSLLFSGTLLFIAAFLVYSNSLSGKFVFDDTVIIQGNQSIRGLSVQNLREIFGGHYWQEVKSQGGLYRPLVMLSYAMNYAVHGETPHGFHLVNVLLHAFNTIWVFMIADLLFGRRALAFLGGLLFALHPIHTEGVTSIVGRAETLSAFFLLAAWYGYVRGRKQGGLRWLILAPLSFWLATMTKESAFSFILLLPLTDIFLAKGSLRDRLPFLPTAMRYLPYAGVLALTLGIRTFVLGGLTPLQINPNSNPMVNAGDGVRFLTATHVFARYAWLLLYPVPLSADYSFNEIPLVTDPGSLRALVPLFLLSATAVAAVIAARRAPFLCFSACVFFATFLLTSNWIRPIGTIMAERLMYLPSLGFTWALAWCLLEAWQRPAWRNTAAVAVWIVIAAYSVRTYDRNWDWQDHRALFRSAVEVSPGSYLVQSNYATILLNEENDARRAAEHARKALEINPEDPAAHYTLAEASQRMGDLAEAAKSYAAVAEAAPGTTGGTSALRRLARIHEDLGNDHAAVSSYEKLLEWRAKDIEGYLALSALYSKVGVPERAAALLNEARRILPGNSEIEAALRELEARR